MEGVVIAMRMSLAMAGWLVVAAAAQDTPPASQPTPAPTQHAPAPPQKIPKPKSRLSLIRQTQVDLDMATPHAKVNEKDRKKIDHCHEVLIDAAAQQQRYKSVNTGKVNGCLKDLDKLLDAGVFPDADRDKLLNDTRQLGDSVGKTRHIRLPQPL